jgi:hypothetical protein
LVFAAGVGMLAVLAYMTGSGPPAESDGFFDAVLIASSQTAPTVALVSVALVTLAYSFRHLWLEWLAYRPGRIEVDPFTPGGSVGECDVEQLTLQFRKRLAGVRLQAPKPVPGAASEGDFLEVLGRAGVDAGNMLGSLLSLARAAKPRHAWQVHGVLVEREEAPRFGLTVQVVQVPDGGSPPVTLWGASWEEAVTTAADYATAAILTRTRLCRTPWATWRRYVMPGRLLRAYESGVDFERDRRYDEALDCYFRASVEDPKNLALRLHIGQLQEKLALHLDALATYMGMLSVDGARPKNRLWRHDGFRARAERRRARLVARYRCVILLGGSELGAQWWRTGRPDGTWTERDSRRRELRSRLRGDLGKGMQKVAEKHAGNRVGKLAPRELLDEVAPAAAPASSDDRRCLELRELFALAALDEAQVVLADSRGLLHDRRVGLSAESVQLTMLCIELRLTWLRQRLRKPGVAATPTSVDAIRDRVDAIEHGGEFTRWHEHYNAACASALPLLDHKACEATGVSEDFARAAVERLEKATGHADSAYISGRRDWLLSEDPDLDGLRAHDAFKDFEAVYFPADRATRLRPPHPQRLESSRYVVELLVQTSLLLERTWHARGRALDGHPDVHTVLRWWADEQETWRLVRALAVDYRHWRTRFELLDHLRRWADANGLERLAVKFPRYEEDPFCESRLAQESSAAVARELADGAVEDADTRLAAIAEAAPKTQATDPPVVRNMRMLQATFRAQDSRGRAPRRFLLAALCDHHAALWQLLREWLDAERGKECVDAKGAFKDRVTLTESVWEHADSWWRNHVLVAAAARGGARPAAALARRLLHTENGTQREPVGTP